jgi:hypothetical protein
MNKEKVRMIIKNIELLLESLKVEVYSENNLDKKISHSQINDYDEIFDEYEV